MGSLMEKKIGNGDRCKTYHHFSNFSSTSWNMLSVVLLLEPDNSQNFFFLNFKQPILMRFQMAVSVLSFVYLRLLLWWWFFIWKSFRKRCFLAFLLLHKNFSFLLFECRLKLLRKHIKGSLNILLLCLYFSPQGHCSISESMFDKQ